ncbi:MAG: trypsin-like peptidase domain-containing protein [Candidatus Yonathbacteria bacterium]|nr:trypsin-like peptidase domain-containing protein [Candidatus Yonathbacteria bacterium]
MEHLTKAQIVLLTLFVSFVASMATGIVVVTLMQQSPEPISQTITNVVERTIEKITPGPTIEKTKSVIIKDEDLMVAAIDRNIKSTVALRTTVGDGGVLPAGVGTIVSSNGLVITDRWNFGLGNLYTTINGVQYTLDVISNDKGNTLGLGRLVPVTGTSTPVFVSVTMGNPDTLKLGQTAIIIGGRDGKTITTGLINNLESHSVTDKDTKVETKVLDNVGVSTRFSGSSNGAPIINLSGEVIGFLSINESAGSQIGVPSSEAKSIIDTVAKAAAAKKI